MILSSDEESEQEVVKPSAGRGRSINLTTRRQKGLTSAQADSSALPARSVPIPSPKRGKAHDQKRAKTVSLYSFFNKTTQSQTTDRTLDRNTPVSSEVEDVQDDDMESMQTTGVAVGSRATNGTGPLISKAGSNTSRNTGRSSARKFVSSKDTTRRSHSPASLGHRSWLEKHTPRHIDELAVHKKKIQDVRNWLENVFAGRDPRVSLITKF